MLRDSGVAVIWGPHNTAAPGDKPKLTYTEYLGAHYYGEKTVGISRYYTAKAHNDRADLLIQIDRLPQISTAHRCQLSPSGYVPDSAWYRILQVQHLLDEDGLPVTDLTLERIDAHDTP